MSCVHWHWIDPPCQEIGKVVERNAAGGASGDGGDQPSYGHEMPRNHRESDDDDDDDLEVPHCQRHFGNILVGTRSTAFLSSWAPNSWQVKSILNKCLGSKSVAKHLGLQLLFKKPLSFANDHKMG